MGTQKNRLNETVLLSTLNTCLNKWIRTYLCFYVLKYCLYYLNVSSYFMMKTLVVMHIGSFKILTSHTVGNMSHCRYMPDCRFMGPKFNPGPVPCFHGDWSRNNFYGHSPPFC